MAAVLAVAVLLLCSSVRSEDVQATITQVKLADSPTTAEALPAIATTTEGSDETHSAVLANEALGETEHGPLVLVDLARSKQENMTTMASASPPTSDSVPPGFDMNEPDDADSQSLAATQDEGTLVQGYPVIGSSEDNSQGQGYGVQTYDAHSASTPEDPSFAATFGDPSFAATQDEGTLVQGYPVIGSSEDNSQGQGYGVQTYDAHSASTPEDPSFAATQDEGTLVQGYPVIGSSEDNSQGQGYGVQTYDAASASTPEDPSFAATFGDPSFAATQDQGTLVQGYPVIGSSEDNSQGQGYGVQTYSASGGDSLAVYGQDVPDSTESYIMTTPPSYRPMPPKPAPAVAWRKGRCTFYGGMDAAGTMSGACGYGNLYASGYGVYTAALSAKLFNNGMACGACYEVACSGKGKPCKAGSIVVTATNFCPPNPGLSANSGGWCNPPNEHFDLSYPAFTKIADPKAGVVPLQFRRVPCKKLGGIRFTLNGNCNFNLVTITNVGGSGVVIEAYMKGDNMAWAPMSRNWGANWQCSRNYCGKVISIKIVTSDKKVSVSRLAGKDWAFGKTYVGQQVK